MSVEISDISQFFEFEWDNWVYLWVNTFNFTGYSMVLGIYFFPSIDVGPALVDKMLKYNVQVVHRSTYHASTQKNIESEMDQSLCEKGD